METDIKSAWKSKINWTQVVGFVSMVAAIKGFEIPQDVQENIVIGIAALWGASTWIWKTYFTNTITPAVAAKLEK